MMTTNKETILKNGYARAAKNGIEPFLTDAELARIYKEKMLAYGKDCGCTFTEEEVSAYIKEQMETMDFVQMKNSAPVELRFQ